MSGHETGNLWTEYITGVRGIDRIAREDGALRWTAKWDRDAEKFRRKVSKYLLYQ